MIRRLRFTSTLLGVAVMAALMSCADGSSSAPTGTHAPINIATTTVAVGERMSIAAMMPGDGAEVTSSLSRVRLTSSNPAVATIDDDGTIVTHGAGTTTISVVGDGAPSAASLIVLPGDPLSFGTTVSVSIDSTTMAVGHTAQAKATVRDFTGAVQNGRVVTWSSTDSSVATVSSTGVVRGIGAGSAYIVATYSGHSGQALIKITDPSAPPPVATVAVSLDRSSIAIGESATATATLKDSAGNTLAGRTITWTSSNTQIATVTSAGVVTGSGTGSTTIVATSEGKTGSATITVTTSPQPPPDTTTYAAPNIATATFDDSTSGPYTNNIPASLTFPADPTGSGRGRVAQIRYTGTGPQQDINKALELTPPTSLSWGSTFFFGGDLYFPNGTVNFTNTGVQRKLLYFRTINSPIDMFFVVHLWGAGMQVEWSQGGNDAVSPQAVTTLSMGTWYRIETQVTLNSSAAASDGTIRVWVNGKVVYETTSVQFTSPTATGNPFWQVWWVGQQREGIDTCGCGAAEPSIDEVRYWDNVSFSTKRVGPGPKGY